MLGVGSSSSGITTDATPGAGRGEPSPGLQTVVSPGLSILGFLLGSPVGALVGFLWGRRGAVGAVGVVLVTLLGGFAGLVLASLLGAETRVTVSGNAVEMEHGPSAAALLGGAILGTALGALVAWHFGRTTPLQPEAHLPA
jgi:hypothetical protein